MLKTGEKPVKFAGPRAVCIVFYITLSILAVPIRDSAAAEADRAARMAKFARPAGVPFPAENSYSPEKAELGRKLFFAPLMSASGTMPECTVNSPHHGRA